MAAMTAAENVRAERKSLPKTVIHAAGMRNAPGGKISKKSR